MLAVALTSLGRSPSFVVGGEVRQLGTNAAGGDGDICVAEGDESDRSVARLPADIALGAERRPRPPRPLRLARRRRRAARIVDGEAAGGRAAGLRRRRRAAGAARAAVRARRGGGAARAGGDARRPSASPSGRRAGRVACSWPCPGAHNAGNACAAALVLEELGVPLADAFAALETFAGRRPALRAGRRARRLPRHRRLRAPPGGARGHARRGARAGAGGAGRRLLPAAHAVAHTRSSPASSPRCWQGADVVVLSETYVARGRPDRRRVGGPDRGAPARAGARPRGRVRADLRRGDRGAARAACGPATSCCAAAPAPSTPSARAVVA